jgi:hypothetical protein
MERWPVETVKLGKKKRKDIPKPVLRNGESALTGGPDKTNCTEGS